MLWLDGKHTVFGQVADDDSMNTVIKLESCGAKSGAVMKVCKIVDCGETK